MKKTTKFYVALFLLSCLLLTFVSIKIASANDIPIVKANPPKSVINNASPIGTLHHPIKSRIPTNKKQVEGLWWWTYYFDGVTNRYDGYRDRGIIEIAGPNETSSENSSTYEISRVVSNSFGTSIGASADFISANVGFQVTYSVTRSWTYTVTVPPGKNNIPTL